MKKQESEKSTIEIDYLRRIVEIIKRISVAILFHQNSMRISYVFSVGTSFDAQSSTLSVMTVCDCMYCVNDERVTSYSTVYDTTKYDP